MDNNDFDPKKYEDLLKQLNSPQQDFNNPIMLTPPEELPNVPSPFMPQQEPEVERVELDPVSINSMMQSELLGIKTPKVEEEPEIGPSEGFLSDLTKYEGYKSQPYDDRTRQILSREQIEKGQYEGYPTVGIGRLLSPEEYKSGKIKSKEGKEIDIYNVSEDDAKYLAKEAPALKDSLNAIKASGMKLNQNQVDSLLSLGYNSGPGAVKSVLNEYGTKGPEAAAAKILEYDKVTDKKTGEKKPLEGLTLRRREEAAPFLAEQASSNIASNVNNINKSERSASLENPKVTIPTKEEQVSSQKKQETQAERLERLVTELRDLQKGSEDSITSGYKKDRTISAIQSIAEGLTNAAYGKGAAGQGTRIAPIELKPIKTNFAEEAREKADSRLQALLAEYKMLGAMSPSKGASSFQQTKLATKEGVPVTFESKTNTFFTPDGSPVDPNNLVDIDQQRRLADSEYRKERAQEVDQIKKQNKVDQEVFKFSKEIDRTNVPVITSALEEVNRLLPKEGEDVPGYGRISGILPDLLVSKEGEDLRAAAQKLFNIELKDRSGAAVTDSEMQRLQKEFGSGTWKSDRQFRKGIEEYTKALQSKIKNIYAGADPEVQEEYQNRLGEMPYDQKIKELKESLGSKSQNKKEEKVAPSKEETVLMRSPDGEQARVRKDQINKYLEMGAEIIDE